MLRRFDVKYFGASVDPPEKNAEFAKSLGLDFPILSDPAKTTARAYGVLLMLWTATAWLAAAGVHW